MAILVFKRKNGVAGILTCMRIATSKVSPLIFFEAYKAAIRGLTFFCDFTSLGFESRQYSWIRDEINISGMETALTHGISGSE